jgi:hypothetical protein
VVSLRRFRTEAVATGCALKRLRGLSHTPAALRGVLATFGEALENVEATYHLLADLCENDPDFDYHYGDCPSVTTRQAGSPKSLRDRASGLVFDVYERAAKEAASGYLRDGRLAREERRCLALKARIRPGWPRCGGPREQGWWLEPPFTERGPDQPAVLSAFVHPSVFRRLSDGWPPHRRPPANLVPIPHAA